MDNAPVQPKNPPLTPAQERARQAAEDERNRMREDDAYEKSKQPYVPDVLRPLMRKKTGGAIKKYARGGGIESRGKTKGRFV